MEDLLNEAILHVDVGMEGLVIVHDPPAFDQEPVALQEKTWGGGEGGEEREEEGKSEIIQCDFLSNKGPSLAWNFVRKSLIGGPQCQIIPVLYIDVVHDSFFLFLSS